MHVLFKSVFLVFFSLLLSYTTNAFQQPTASDLEVYQRYFQDSQKREADKEIALTPGRLRDALEVKDMKTVAQASKVLGFHELTRTHDYERAINFFVQALNIEDSLGLKKEQVFTYLGIAGIFEEVGDHTKSAALLEEAMNLNAESNDLQILMLIHNKLGRINAARGFLDEAFNNYEHVLKFQAELDEPAVEAEALYNIAHLHRLQGDFQKSLEYHKQALTIRRGISDKKSEAVSLNDIGELYRLMKNDEKALANHVVALEIRRGLKDSKAIAESYNNIGILYYHQQNIERAVANLQLALEAARESNATEQILKSTEYLGSCFKDLGDFKRALEYKEEFLGRSELAQREKNEQRLLDIQSRYEIGKKEVQIEKLETIRAQRDLQLREEARVRKFLFILIGLSLVIGALVLYLYILKRRSNNVLKAVNDKVQQQNTELQELNATKDKFFSIISHDLKGPLNSLTSFSGLLINHTDSLTKEEITLLAKDLDKSLKNLFALLENLLEWSRSQTGNIEFKPETFDVNTLLELNRELLQPQAQNKKITIVNENVHQALVHAHKHSVNTVVRNLISNAIKFTPAEGKITLRVHAEPGSLKVFVSDTGVGMSHDIMDKLFRIDTKHTTRGTADEKGTGLGLILCKEFIEKNGGRIGVESEVGNGSVFHFTLPVQVPANAPSVITV